MRYTFTTFFMCVLLLIRFNSNAQTGWEWGRRNTGKGGISAWPSVVDTSGNLYLAGSVYGIVQDSLVFGTHGVYNSGHHNQLIVTKVDTAGNYLWAIGSHGADVGCIAVADNLSGDVYVVGEYSGSSVTFGAITLTNSSPYIMVFIEKVSSSGVVLWAQNILTDEGGIAAPLVFGIGVDGAGNAYVTGSFYQNQLLFGSTLLVNHGPGQLSCDIVLLKYNSAGTLKWAKSFGGNHDDYPLIEEADYSGFDYGNNIMSVTRSGHIYLTGLFYSDSIKIGNTTLYNPNGGANEPGPTYSYLSKWDSNGNTIWTKYIDKKIDVNEITANGREEIFLAGFLDSAETWNSYTLNPGAVVAKLDSAGNLTWVHTVAGGDAKSIGIGDSASVFITGLMTDSMNFNGNILNVPTIHSAPMFVAYYDLSGNYLNSLAVADGAISSCAIRPDKFGAFFLVGNYYGTPLTFGPDFLDTAHYTETAFISRYRYAATPATVLQQNLTLDNDIVLYPNPTIDFITIKAKERISTLCITNMMGQNIISINPNVEVLQLDVSGIPAGYYFVRINNSIVRKFVKVTATK